jgi:hypothetical protein
MPNISKAIKPKWSLHDLPVGTQNREHDLYESLIVEFTDIAGIEMDYYMREDDRVSIDTLYGEPLHQHVVYRTAARSKLLYEVTEEPTLTSPFGINSEDIVQYAAMPKFTFSRDVSGGGYHPKPGDVMVTVWNDRAYEVVDVHEEESIFQLKKLAWGFILRPYRFSEQSQDAEDIARFTRDPSDALDASTLTTPLSAFGNNEYIETESDAIDDFDDIDTSIYGY